MAAVSGLSEASVLAERGVKMERALRWLRAGSKRLAGNVLPPRRADGADPIVRRRQRSN